MPDSVELTQMLLHWSRGDQQTLDQLFPVVYAELKRLAHARLRNERPDHTLNTTALVHEAYFKLVDLKRVQLKDRTHFFALASRVMRHLLINYAEKRKALKRGGGQQHVELDEERLFPDTDVERVLELDEALKQLAKVHPRAAKVVEQNYFGGLTNEEAAVYLDVSRATVERDLRLARAWLARALGSIP